MSEAMNTKTTATTSLRGDVVTPSGVRTHCVLRMHNGVITEIVEDTELSDAQRETGDAPAGARRILLPGLADLHNHGGAGESFPTSDAEGCARAARHHLAHGTTTLLASTVSMLPETLLPQLALLAELAQDGLLAGIHAEGPFVNACRCGAQDPAAIIEGDPELFARMIEAAGGYLRSVTLAPETRDARRIVDLCAEHQVIVSLGHTDADFATTAELVAYANERGATITATHLFNAMPPIHHRAPGAAAAMVTAAAEHLAHVELVADGVHLDDHTVDFVCAAVGHDRATFVSDAMGAAGQADGRYRLGALDVTVSGGVARLTTSDGSQGAIAGGTSRVIDQVRRHAKRGVPLEQVVRAATSGHALLGLRRGLEVGAPADVVVCDEDFTVMQVYRHGELVGASGSPS